MVRDPGDLYQVGPDAPELDDVTMLYYFDGFIDAGGAGRLLTAHLLSAIEHTEVARFDVDSLIDYRSRRPVMTFAKDHWEDYDAPEIAVSLLHDTAGTPFLLLNGPEPDHDWNAFTGAVLGMASALRVRLAVGFHGIPMGVPHTRPLGVTAHATQPGLIEGYRPLVDKLQVPGSAAALLEYRLGQDERAAVGFAVHVPHYLAQAAYPAAAVTPSCLVCGTPIGMPWKLTASRTFRLAVTCRTAAVNASHSRSGSRPLSSRNCVPSESRSSDIVSSGAS